MVSPGAHPARPGQGSLMTTGPPIRWRGPARAPVLHRLRGSWEGIQDGEHDGDELIAADLAHRLVIERQRMSATSRSRTTSLQPTEAKQMTFASAGKRL